MAAASTVIEIEGMKVVLNGELGFEYYAGTHKEQDIYLFLTPDLFERLIESGAVENGSLSDLKKNYSEACKRRYRVKVNSVGNFVNSVSLLSWDPDSCQEIAFSISRVHALAMNPKGPLADGAFAHALFGRSNNNPKMTSSEIAHVLDAARHALENRIGPNLSQKWEKVTVDQLLGSLDDLATDLRQLLSEQESPGKFMQLPVADPLVYRTSQGPIALS